MATLIDVSGALGEFMLKGWVLTDRICTKCGRVPLMRSPPSAATETQFCVSCDPAPSSGNAANAPSFSHSRVPAVPQPSLTQDAHSISSTSISSGMSRPSTPPTEISNAPSSPTFAPVMDTAEILRRRQQSDTASTEIGKRMLKGWAMLADECPNPDCYGIPLVRPPRSGGNIDPRKECVICGIVYVNEKDAYGQDRLVPIQPQPHLVETSRIPDLTTLAQSSISSVSVDKGKARAYPIVSSQPQVPAVPQHVQNATTMLPSSSTSSALGASAQSLEHTLIVLSERLNSYASGPIIDPTPIGQTADAISKVSLALTQVKQLLWSENRALHD